MEFTDLLLTLAMFELEPFDGRLRFFQILGKAGLGYAKRLPKLSRIDTFSIPSESNTTNLQPTFQIAGPTSKTVQFPQKIGQPHDPLLPLRIALRIRVEIQK